MLTGMSSQLQIRWNFWGVSWIFFFFQTSQLKHKLWHLQAVLKRGTYLHLYGKWSLNYSYYLLLLEGLKFVYSIITILWHVNISKVNLLLETFMGNSAVWPQTWRFLWKLSLLFTLVLHLLFSYKQVKSQFSSIHRTETDKQDLSTYRTACLTVPCSSHKIF